MKKLYALIAIALIGTLTATAQNDKKSSGKIKFSTTATAKIKPQGLTNARHASGTNHVATTVWSDDFSNGANWVIDHQAGTTGDWVIGTTGPSGPFAIDPIASTTAANGFALFDSDLICSYDQVGNLTTANSIDCSSIATAKLSFSQYYARYYDSTYVFVSADNVNWTRFEVNGNMVVNDLSLTNPETVNVDISSVAANQSTVWVRFQFYSPNALAVDTSGCAYAWMIDDVSISDYPSADVSTLGILVPFNGCALGASEEIFTAFINKGTTDITGFDASYTINGGTPVTENITTTILAGDTLFYTFTTLADFSAPGVYDVAVYCVAAGDGDLTNDTAYTNTASGTPSHVNYNMGFETTDDFSLYSVEDADGDGSTIDISATYVRTGLACLRYTLPNSASSDNWVFTNCIDFDQNDVYGLDFWFKVFDNTAVPFNVEAYLATSQNSADATTLLASPPVPGDTSYTNVHTTFSVPTTGTYYIAFRGFGTNVDNTTRIDDITIDLVSGIKNTDLNKAMMVYPNPSNGRIFVENTSATEKSATVSVLNTVGQTVYTNNFSNLVKESIDLSNQPDGLYTVRISTASGVVNKTVVVSSK